MKAAFRWAAKKGYIERSPIGEDSQTLKRGRPGKRHRRLAPLVLDAQGRVVEPSEEDRLLAAAPSHLYRLIVAALETACRQGELLALTWADVDLDGRRLRIRAETAKDAEERVLPISERLAAVLEMARTDPAGERYPGTAFVFRRVGQPVGSIKKTWESTVLKAHGHTPTWGPHGALSGASRAQ